MKGLIGAAIIIIKQKFMRTIFFAFMLIVFDSGNLLGQTTITVYSYGDNSLDELYTTTNRGSCDRVYLTGGTNTRQRGLFRFNISSIPAGATITSAKLYLYRILGNGSGNVNVHRVTTNWTEGTGPCSGTLGIVSNWNQRETGTNWNTPGGDYNSNADASIFVSTATGLTNSWDIQSLVNGWYNGTFSNYGLIIKYADEADYNQMTFATREYSGTTNDPRLVITYIPTPTPVELVSFNAKVSKNSALLNWETATEVNNYGFEVERQNAEVSSQKSEWEKVGFVEGHGNSNSPKFYQYSDASLNTSGKYYYRLKQIDIDGKYEYSEMVEINISSPDDFSLSQNYPNPFNPTTKIKYSIPSNNLAAGNNGDVLVTLKIYDILGKEIKTLVNENQSAGIYEVDFNAHQLSSGMYFYTLQAAEFRQTNKMILAK